MASTYTDDLTERKTRLQEKTEKQRAMVQLKEKDELKRRKKMFAPRKVIGPRDILVNSKVPKIKLEYDVGCSSSVKQENLEIDSTNLGQFSEIDEFIQPWTLDLDKNGISIAEDQKDSSCGTNSELEINQSSKNHIELLKHLAQQKDQEINLLNKLIRGLQDHSFNDNKQVGVEKLCINSYDAQVLAQITSDLTEKDAKIKLLSKEMLKLQNNIFGAMENNLEEASRQLVQESFEMVLPFLYPELSLNDLLNCRRVCRAWCYAIEKFLNTHSSLLHFNKDLHTEKLRKLELGCILSRNESPLDKLAKAYQFSDSRAFDIFTKNTTFKILGSAVILDNIILEDPRYSFFLNINFLERFLTIFGVHIKYLKIRQNVELPDFKISLLMDRVKLCLSELPNLKGLTVVFCVDAYKIQKKSAWDALKAIGNAEYESWQINNFPSLKSLESLIIEVDIAEGWTGNAGFLWKFSKSLIQPYAKQLKQLSIFAHGIGPEYSLEAPNLVQLTIPRKFIGNRAEWDCKLVEKCTVTSSTYVLIPNDVVNLERLFPKLICFGIKFEYAGGTINEMDWSSYATKLPGVITLELENCGGVAFTILCCFPNLRHIRLFNKHTNKIEDSDVDTVLNITQLWKGRNLYESILFWQHFPNISLVSLEFSGDPVTNVEPKNYTWTRTGYTNYLCKKMSE